MKNDWANRVELRKQNEHNQRQIWENRAKSSYETNSNAFFALENLNLMIAKVQKVKNHWFDEKNNHILGNLLDIIWQKN